MTHVRFGASGIIFEDDFRFGAFRVGEGATTFSASDFLGCPRPFFAAMISSFFWFFESLINIIFFQIKITSLCRFNPRDDIGYSIFLGLAPTRGARSFSGAKSHNGSSDMKIQDWCGNTLGKLLFQLELLAQIYPTTRLIHSSFFIRIIYYSRLFEHHPHFFTGESN